MPETIGKITKIKLSDFLSADFAMITLKTTTGPEEHFFLWYSNTAVEPAVRRVLQSQRLALAREAAFRQLDVHLIYEDSVSSIVTAIQVDIA